MCVYQSHRVTEKMCCSKIIQVERFSVEKEDKD